MKNKHKRRKSLKTYNSQTPKIYGLPKLHEQNTLLGPIVNNINETTYKLSKYIASILENIGGNSIHHVKDTHIEYFFI